MVFLVDDFFVVLDKLGVALRAKRPAVKSSFGSIDEDDSMEDDSMEELE